MRNLNDEFTRAIAVGDFDAVQGLLDSGVGIGAIYSAPIGFQYDACSNSDVFDCRCTALALAAEKGHSKILQLLLTRGANIEAIHAHGCTALIRAASGGHNQSVQQLLDCSANIEAINAMSVIYNYDQDCNRKSIDYGQCTALLCAIKNGYINTVQLLFDRGANIRVTDGGGFIALTLAVKAGYSKIVQFLVQCGLQIDVDCKYVISHMSKHDKESVDMITNLRNKSIAYCKQINSQFLQTNFVVSMQYLKQLQWLNDAQSPSSAQVLVNICFRFQLMLEIPRTLHVAEHYYRVLKTKSALKMLASHRSGNGFIVLWRNNAIIQRFILMLCGDLPNDFDRIREIPEGKQVPGSIATLSKDLFEMQREDAKSHEPTIPHNQSSQ